MLTAFTLQQWLHESSSILRYTHIACLVITDTKCFLCDVRVEAKGTVEQRSYNTTWHNKMAAPRLIRSMNKETTDEKCEGKLEY